MLQEKKKIVSLLAEFDEICAGLGIEYVLYGPLANTLLGITTERLDRPIVIMLSKDMLKLYDYLKEERKPYREVECYATNERYPFFTLRYVDTGTTWLDTTMPFMYKCNGLSVEIIPLRTRRLAKNTALYFFEKIQRRLYGDDLINYNDRSGLVVSTAVMIHKRIPARIKAMLFRKMCKYYNDTRGEEMWMFNCKGRIKKVPLEVMRQAKRVSIGNGSMANIPGDIAVYSELVKGDIFYPPHSEDMIFFDGGNFTNEVLTELKDNCIGERLVKSMKEYNKYSFLVNELNVEIEKIWRKIKELYSKKDD